MTTTTNHHTADDAANAFDLMSKRERLLLLAKIEKHSRRSTFSSPMDMLSEVVSRTIEGRRHWPIGVPFEAFAVNAARSIASDERRRVDFKNISIDGLESWEEDGRSAPSPQLARFCQATASPSAEDGALARERLQILADLNVKTSILLANDELAKKAAEGYLVGMTPRELQSLLGIESKAMRAANQRAHRAFATALRNMKF